MLDWALAQPGVTAQRTAVIGHSRLGKTALGAGMRDQRFACVISNASGCSGAALARENTGETVAAICDRFPYWFCDHYRQYANAEEAMPFEQDWLVSGIALQLGVGYTAGYLVYQIGTLITTGALGAGFLPGLIAVAVIVGVIVYLCANADKKLAKDYALNK